MLTIRSAAAAVVLTVFSGGAALAATCNMTVQGALVIDDQECTVAKSGETTRISVATYGTITVRGEAMSAQVAPAPSDYRRRRTDRILLGSVVRSPDVEDRTCYFGQKAVLCIE